MIIEKKKKKKTKGDVNSTIKNYVWLPPLFYKKYWEVIGLSIIKAVRNFFISSKTLKEVNYSFIVLIPKIINPSTINHYRPISLCNTIYKVISKLLVDRLRAIIPI